MEDPIKSVSWQNGQIVCRCCLAEGCYKDIGNEYFWMGKREVYEEMLSETFDVKISNSSSGNKTRPICEACISRLRDASEFKRQVMECEKMFIQQLEPGTSAVAEIIIAPERKEVKVEGIKLEKLEDSEDDAEVVFEDLPGADDDDDDMDDEPLMKFATKEPKKEVELLKLLTGAGTSVVKRKSTTISTKASASPSKRAKIEKPAPSPSKAKKIITIKRSLKPEPTKAAPSKKKKTAQPEKKKDMLKDMDDVRLMKWNAEIIVKFTTAYPFRLPYDKVICVYCSEKFEDFALFRRHMDENHQTYNRKVVFAHVSSENFLKLDCTELSCRLCKVPFQKLADIANHLRADHKAKLRLEKGLDLLPYILAKDKIACGICGSNQPGVRHLGRHIANHFQRFTCESCGKSYINNTGLKVHVRSCTKRGIYPCSKCHKEFASTEERRQHVVSSKRCWHYVCEFCKARFVSWRQKQEHLVGVHGRPKRTHTCPECGEVFEKGDWFRKHFRTVHSHRMLKCSYCDKLWENKHSLDRHLVTHTKEKPFPCEYCSKAFGTKTLLTQHSWMHKEDKRFECTICDKKFNQRVSWRSHMKSRHPEFGIV